MYEVEKGVPAEVIQIANKDYFGLTEDYRKSRHLRITKFLQEKLKGPIFENRDNVWFDVFLRHMSINHFSRGDIVYKEFQSPEYFYIVHTGLLAVEKQIEVKYSNMWPIANKQWTHT